VEPGALSKLNFTEGMYTQHSSSREFHNVIATSPFKYVKHQIDELNKENFMCRNTMIEGDTLGDKLQSIDYKVKFEATSDGGSVCRMTSKDNSKKALQVEEEEI